MTEFETAAREFIASRGAARTRAAYSGDLERWLGHCVAAGADPAAPTLATASAFRDVLKEALAPLTVRRVLSSLSAMYAHATAREAPLATWNPFSPQALPRPPGSDYNRTEEVADADAERIFAAAEADDTDVGRRDAAILHVLYSTGLRRMSVAGLRRAKIVGGEAGTVIVVPVKGGGTGRVEVPDRAAAALRRWLVVAPRSRWAFPLLRGDAARPISVSVVNRVFARRAEEAGVAHVHPHQFRAAFATRALDAGAPLRDVQAAMGHASPETTLRYDRGRRGAGVAAAVEEYRAKRK